MCQICARRKSAFGILHVQARRTTHNGTSDGGGSVIVWFGLPWSLELYEQGNGRIHRQRQTRPVFVYHLVTIGTLDEDVMSVLGRKAAGQAALLEAVKARLNGCLTA